MVELTSPKTTTTWARSFGATSAHSPAGSRRSGRHDPDPALRLSAAGRLELVEEAAGETVVVVLPGVNHAHFERRASSLEPAHKPKRRTGRVPTT
jgi:hypothetical protein